MIVTQLNPMKLILEASRRIDELSVFKKVIPNDRMVFRMSGKVQSKEEIKLNANEWRVLSLIDGSRSVRQVVMESGYDEFAVYKIFFSVISSGLIEQKDEISLGNGENDSSLSGIITVFNDVLQSVKKILLKNWGNEDTPFSRKANQIWAIPWERYLKISASINPRTPILRPLKRR